MHSGVNREQIRWLTPDSQTENYVSLFFAYPGKDLSVDIKWEMKIWPNKQTSAYVHGGILNQIAIELPLWFWKMSEQAVDFEMELMDFEMKIKTSINILFTFMELKKPYKVVSVN